MAWHKENGFIEKFRDGRHLKGEPAVRRVAGGRRRAGPAGLVREDKKFHKAKQRAEIRNQKSQTNQNLEFGKLKLVVSGSWSHFLISAFYFLLSAFCFLLLCCSGQWSRRSASQSRSSVISRP
jgi:hypothetical protein